MVGEGYQYTKVRGWVGGVAMGSPDCFRPEGARGNWGIDSNFIDGVVINGWNTKSGRVHYATYAAGLATYARDFSYYVSGNCIGHGGTEFPPDWLGQK